MTVVVYFCNYIALYLIIVMTLFFLAQFAIAYCSEVCLLVPSHNVLLLL